MLFCQWGEKRKLVFLFSQKVGWHRARTKPRDAAGAQSIKCPGLDFGSGHDPWVVRLSPESDSTLRTEPA